ncbi:MAG: hypothetical protein VX715_02455 [Planctomycetota bacterium]|nr:hypothetical protein [Planctomycetota bacterium]
MHKKLLVLAVGAMLIATVGCGSGYPPVQIVKGTVMYNGAPLAEATVTFHPSEANDMGAASRASSGETDAQGVFRLTTNYVDGTSVVKLDGAPSGTYSVTVTKLKKKVYADVGGAPPETNEDNTGVNDEYFAEMGNLNEDGSSNLKEESLISTKFRLAYETPLTDIEVAEGENDFKVDINENGTGTVN